MGNKSSTNVIDRLKRNTAKKRGENYQTEVIETHLIERNPLIDALVVSPVISIRYILWLTIKKK
jgi:hypothetical protein